MPAVEWISIEGFRSIKSITKLRLEPINVIIGSNGSGKSNFISAFSFLHAIRHGRLQEYVKRAGGADEILHFGRANTEIISFHLAFAGEKNQYSIELAPTAQGDLFPLEETAYYWDKSKYPSPYSLDVTPNGTEAGVSIAQASGIITYVRNHLDKWRLYHFHDTSSSSPLKRIADVSDNRFLRPDGSNLPAFLYMLQEVHPMSFKMIGTTIREVAPFFSDFFLKPMELNENKIELQWLEKGHEQFMSYSALSDGTIRFIALATLLMQPSHLMPSVILIDEPELGLHPFALSVLAGMIKYASQNAQVIISTQSALLLDHFEPENVLVADRVEDNTVFNRLSSGPLEEWLSEYSLGQLWEKAEFGGRPR